MIYESDAEYLAETILDDWRGYCESKPEIYYCNYCCEISEKGYKELIHDPDCPVLVAKDLLTKEYKKEKSMIIYKCDACKKIIEDGKEITTVRFQPLNELFMNIDRKGENLELCSDCVEKIKKLLEDVNT